MSTVPTAIGIITAEIDRRVTPRQHTFYENAILARLASNHKVTGLWCEVASRPHEHEIAFVQRRVHAVPVHAIEGVTEKMPRGRQPL